MLQDFREQKNSPLIAILFGIIILVFVLMFGLPSARDSCVTQKNTNMATVNGQKIGQDLMRSMIMRYYGSDVFGTQRYPMAMRQTTEGIATLYLLADEARKAGLRVSDEELADYIRNWEAGNPDVRQLGFLYKNQFLQRSYENALSGIQMSSQAYEDYKRKELLARKYLILMQSSINVSEESLWQDYAMANATASIEAVRLTPKDISATLLPLEEAEVSAFESSGAADIKKYYDEHINDFTTPAKAQLQQITIQKDISKLTNPGAKTDKTYQPNNRFSIASAAVKENPDNFGQFFDDYDESDNKDTKGVTILRDIDQMDEAIQAALEGKKVGEILTAELSNRYIIAKLLDRTETIVQPLDEVKHEIARKILEDRRIEKRTQEAASNIIAQVKAGKSLEDALNETLYANVLAEQPMMAVDSNSDSDDGAQSDDTNTDTAENGDNAEAGEQSEAAQEPVMVAVPTELPIIPEYDRVSVQTANDILIDSGFLSGINVISDDLARDIRNSAPETILPKPYQVGEDTIIARVVSKKEANHDLFMTELDGLRNEAIQKKSSRLIGDINGILTLNGEYGVWVEQIRSNAKTSGTFTINEGYLNKMTEKYADSKRR